MVSSVLIEEVPVPVFIWEIDIGYYVSSLDSQFVYKYQFG